VPGHQHITWSGVVFFCASLQTSSCHAADLQEIIGRGTAAIQSDWAADPDYAYVERDEVQKNDKRTSKTYKVVMIEGSDYNLPIAVNDQLLDPNQGKAELQRLKNEVSAPEQGKSCSAPGVHTRFEGWNQAAGRCERRSQKSS
jgi:hypothetical protein